MLRIAREQSSKGNDAWAPVISARIAELLERWLAQREAIEAYDSTDTLWITTKGNPYTSRSLSYLMNQLCEIAGIDTANRQVT